MLRIHSAPLGIGGEGQAQLATLLARADTLGLLDDVDAVTPELLHSLLLRLGQLGLIQRSLVQGLAEHPSAAALATVNDALAGSPLPELEWAGLRSALGDPLLAELSAVSESSVRRYASGERLTPDDVADRLHTLALVVADLKGAYNDYGVRRWFLRGRSQLQGRSPVELLASVGAWSSEDPGPLAVRSLASALTGSPAT